MINIATSNATKVNYRHTRKDCVAYLHQVNKTLKTYLDKRESKIAALMTTNVKLTCECVEEYNDNVYTCFLL